MKFYGNLFFEQTMRCSQHHLFLRLSSFLKEVTDTNFESEKPKSGPVNHALKVSILLSEMLKSDVLLRSTNNKLSLG